MTKRWFVYWVDGTWTEVVERYGTLTVTIPYRKWPQSWFIR